MGTGSLRDFVGEWELTTDLPGGEGIRGRVVFETMGDVLVQRTTVPVPEAPDSCALVVTSDDGGFVQHYFDARGVVRLYEMTFDGRTWTLERTKTSPRCTSASASPPRSATTARLSPGSGRPRPTASSGNGTSG
jgi:hypothetical protein